MIHKIFHTVVFLFVVSVVSAQNQISIDGVLDPEHKTITIQQEIKYTNTSKDTLQEIFLQDWSNSFVNKTTALGKRFSEDYKRRFYFAKDLERGHTDITSITNTQAKSLSWERYNNIADIIRVELNDQLLPGQEYVLRLAYTVKLPSDKFTRFGYDSKNNFSLKYWHITPAVYDTQWNIYSNKDLDDLYTPVADYQIVLSLPKSYTIASGLQQQTIPTSKKEGYTTVILEGKNRNDTNLYIEEKTSFYEITIDNIQLVSNVEDNNLMKDMKSVATKRILTFLKDRLGNYPFKKILVSENDYQRNPVYGLNQLPDILRPFPDGFQYEIKQLKVITDNYLKSTLLIDSRHDAWIKDALHIYLMMAYTEKFYPDMKLLGNLSKIIGVRWFHAADLNFNDQYYLGYKNMARLFLDQPLTESKDKLVKFNENIANAYKAGVGFKYLEDYLEDDNIVNQAIKDFYTQNLLQFASSKDFERILKTSTSKNIDWFFEDYTTTNEKLDFKIKSVKKRKDSLEVTVGNNRNNAMPISITALRDKQMVSKTWVTDITGSKKVKIANEDIDKLVLDYEQRIPEVNRRNNHRNLKWILNRPIQFRFLQDVEDPTRSQVFYIPEFEFNVYDGFTIGSKFYNKTFIRKQFNYNITPSFGFLSQKLVGSASFTYRQQIAEDGLYLIRYGLSGNRFSYAPDLLFNRFSPFVTFSFRPKDLRANENQRLSLRSINVFRDRDENNPVETPDYSVFNIRYRYSDPNLIDLTSYILDYQIAKNFSKISTTINYRKLFLNNRQLNLRLFAGAFLFNDTQKDGDFFSFALDRPTDYLFDFNYLGRSENSGLVSQQIILAEGGFKSQLDYPFANQWITTFNANTNIWNWIYLYGDIGLVKNKGVSPKFVYDTGIRASLVADYFELFFPIASNNGFEINQPNYGEKIRFIVTLSPETLIRLFTRRWY